MSFLFNVQNLSIPYKYEFKKAFYVLFYTIELLKMFSRLLEHLLTSLLNFVSQILIIKKVMYGRWVACFMS